MIHYNLLKNLREKKITHVHYKIVKKKKMIDGFYDPHKT
jgi:hypothetical protein